MKKWTVFCGGYSIIQWKRRNSIKREKEKERVSECERER